MVANIQHGRWPEKILFKSAAMKVSYRTCISHLSFDTLTTLKIIWEASRVLRHARGRIGQNNVIRTRVCAFTYEYN
jgi:hypothetical protein